MRTIDLLNKTSIKEAFPKIANLSEIITQTVIPKFDEVSHYSELRLLGDYEVCHPINVAIMAGMIAKKMDFEKDFISDIILAGILHDIAKGLSFDQIENIVKENYKRKINYPKYSYHAYASEFIAKRDFLIKDKQILKAIKCHCRPTKNMSKLDKIIYFVERYVQKL